MNTVSFRASKSKPCPVCLAGSKGCSATADGLSFCRGIEPFKPPPADWREMRTGPDDNGFRHFRRIDDPPAPGPVPRDYRPKPPKDWPAEAARFAESMTKTMKDELARRLRLPVSSLEALPLIGVNGPAYTFPECDGSGNIIGISQRFIDGKKNTLKESRRGLTIPAGWHGMAGPLFIVEGPSDTLAMMAAGLPAIGRPSNTGGSEYLAELLKGSTREIVIVGENDQKADGSWPGRTGAESVVHKLAAALRRPIRVAFPPDESKDVRDWLTDESRQEKGWDELGQWLAEELKRTWRTVEPPEEEKRSGKSNDTEVILETLAGRRCRPVCWLVPGRIPLGKLTLIAADGGAGKSTMTRHLVAKVTDGRPSFGLNYETGGPAGVLLLASEDNFEDTVMPHLIAEGANLELVFDPKIEYRKADGEGNRIPLGPQHVDRLKKTLAENPGIKLVIIDPIISWTAKAGLNDSKAAEVRTLLDPLAELAEETGVALLVIAHVSKADIKKAAYRVAGSAQYVNAVRLAYILVPDRDESRRLLVPLKKNLLGVEKDAATFRMKLIDEGTRNRLRSHLSMAGLNDADFGEVTKFLSVVEFGENVAADPDEVAGTDRLKPGPADDTRRRCMDWLKAKLADGPKRVKDINEDWRDGECGSEKTLRNARERLGKNGGTNEVNWYRPIKPGEVWLCLGEPPDTCPGFTSLRETEKLGQVGQVPNSSDFLPFPNDQNGHLSQSPSFGQVPADSIPPATSKRRGRSRKSPPARPADPLDAIRK